MTLREFHIALEGYRGRQRESQRFQTSLALMVRNVHVAKKDQKTVSQVIKGEGRPFMATTAAQADAYFEKHNARVLDKRDRRNRNLEAMMRRGAPVVRRGA